MAFIQGFSKLSKQEKIQWLCDQYGLTDYTKQLENSWYEDEHMQKIHEGFSENTVGNFHLPFGIAPNFLIDGKIYAVPMAIEESSVVAAASSAAKFWSDRGGIRTTILGTTKVGQVHFRWKGPFTKLTGLQSEIFHYLLSSAEDITENMKKRGGGITRLEFIDFSSEVPNLFQLRVHFETCDSMGANFINTVLEHFASMLDRWFIQNESLPAAWRDVEIIMSILSNYTPECVVRAEVSCTVEDFDVDRSVAIGFIQKFVTAIRIAEVDPYRATTHNKGIYNGIDAVVLATGNDFRAIEAAGHTYAARNGRYQSLSFAEFDGYTFKFGLEVPLAVGTVGGLTNLHPMAKIALQILGNPNAQTLMSIIASVGLAQNFAAVKSLVTTGIQKGHMKMHLQNILMQLHATPAQQGLAMVYFADKVVSYSEVRRYLEHSAEKS